MPECESCHSPANNGTHWGTACVWWRACRRGGGCLSSSLRQDICARSLCSSLGDGLCQDSSISCKRIEQQSQRYNQPQHHLCSNLQARLLMALACRTLLPWKHVQLQARGVSMQKRCSCYHDFKFTALHDIMFMCRPHLHVPEASEMAIASARAATLPRADASAMARLAAFRSFFASAWAIAVAAALLLGADACCDCLR